MKITMKGSNSQPILANMRTCAGIGTGYMRSTNKATAALKATYQTPVYPLLDAVRCELGSKIDKELAHLKVDTVSPHAVHR